MNIEKVELETFDSLLEENDEMNVYLKFYADWCGPCKNLNNIIHGMANIEGVKIFEVDVDTESELALRYNVRSLPTIVHVGSNRTLIGLPSTEKLIEFLNGENDDQ